MTYILTLIVTIIIIKKKSNTIQNLNTRNFEYVYVHIICLHVCTISHHHYNSYSHSSSSAEWRPLFEQISYIFPISSNHILCMSPSFTFSRVPFKNFFHLSSSYITRISLFQYIHPLNNINHFSAIVLHSSLSALDLKEHSSVQCSSFASIHNHLLDTLIEVLLKSSGILEFYISKLLSISPSFAIS